MFMLVQALKTQQQKTDRKKLLATASQSHSSEFLNLTFGRSYYYGILRVRVTTVTTWSETRVQDAYASPTK